MALLGGRLATRLGYPSVLGELLGGIILGPPVIGLLSRSEPLDLPDTGPVVLVDTNDANIEAARASGLAVYKGNALDDLVLQEAGIDQTMTFIAATANPEVNLLAVRAAQELGVADVLMTIPQSVGDRFDSMLEEVGADSLVIPETTLPWDEAIQRGLVEQRSIDQTEAPDGEVTGTDPGEPVFPLVVGSEGDRRLASRKRPPGPGEPYLALVRRTDREPGGVTP